MKKYRMVFILCLFFSFFCPLMVCAKEFVSAKEGLDVMFVMDYSGSMKTNDSRDIARGMVKAFVDTVHSADIRVGFVAYNDRILTFTSPLAIQTEEERADLKKLIDQEQYAGNTDIGLGLSYGLELLEEEAVRKRVIVLISDGEPDLEGSNTGRTTEISKEDLKLAAEKCTENGIQIYSIAFGDYDGNTEVLKSISESTSAQMYSAETPERLIEVLYGIFGTNMDYSIQKITDGVFAHGIQNFHVGLEENYTDEMDVLLISPEKIGNVSIFYDGQELPTANHGNYVVGKIIEPDNEIRELDIRTETLESQELQLYLISYRSLTPVLEVNTSFYKNEQFSYELHFRDKNGELVKDTELYQKFTCQFTLGTEENGSEMLLDADALDGGIQGEKSIGQSGTFCFRAYLEDSMGNHIFAPVQITVKNRKPEGKLPEQGMITMLTGERQYVLDECFSDPDGDKLFYSLVPGTENIVQAGISDGILTVRPQKAGIQVITLSVSDGEYVSLYNCEIDVTPLWRAYWWFFPLLAVVVAVLLRKRIHHPKEMLEQLEEDTKQNHFCGKLDAYFTVQPEIEEEIPPLSFQLYKAGGNSLVLGMLLKEYPETVDALGLDSIYLIADADRRMVLYHTSESSVMIGNSIACRQIQYSVSFGDVIYITSLNGSYELEIHYIAVIQ